MKLVPIETESEQSVIAQLIGYPGKLSQSARLETPADQLG